MIKDIKYYSSIIIFIGMTMIICIDANIFFNYAFAISSFPRLSFEELNNPCTLYGYSNNVIDFDCLEDNDMKTANNLPLPVNITHISYLSNGDIFNATLWLNSPLYDNKYSDYVEANLSFITDIYKIERPSNKIPKKTNTIYIYPEENGNWTYKLFEIHPDQVTPGRLIETSHNHNSIYQNGKNFVHIPLNLNSIGNPEKFGIQFQVNAETDYSELNFLKTKGKQYLVDISNWDTIPPSPLQIILEEPHDIKVAAGEAKKIEKPVSIHALDLNIEQRIVLNDGNNTDGINLSFNPSQIDLPLNGTKYTEMRVETSKDLEPKIYNAIIINTTSGIISTNSSDPISKTYKNETETITIEILNPLTLVDKLNNFLINDYGLFIIPIVFSTIFAVYLFIRVNKPISGKIEIPDLLSLDGAVIAGVLIFLTLGALGSNQGITAILTSTIVFPFALSAITTLLGRSIIWGVKLTMLGFVYLMVSIVLIAYIQFQFHE